MAATVTRRKRDWAKRLDGVYKAHRDTPFSWGSHDCIRAAANCVHAMTDVDPFPHRDQMYCDRQSAVDLMRAMGGFQPMVEAFMDSHYERIRPLLAGPGDVVLVEHNHQRALAVVWLDGRPMVPVTPGWAFVRPIDGRIGWRIP